MTTEDAIAAEVGTREGPVYVRIADAIQAAVLSGGIQPGDRLPAQRSLAARLAVDFTTITRAYGLARERGLLEGEVGRGTFIRSTAGEEIRSVVDLSMNVPPQPFGISLAAALDEELSRILKRSDLAAVMAYRAATGAAPERAAGARWLRLVLGEVDPGRVVVTAGAQAGLNAVMQVRLKAADSLVVDALTYPGLISAARQRGLRLIPVEADEEGMSPDALEAACRDGAKALYIVPTLYNPSAGTLSETRRRRLAEIARKHDLVILEDDAYGRLPDESMPALAAFAPERTFHVATLSKSLSPGLRTAFVVAPDEAAARETADAAHAQAMMPAPLMSAVFAGWVQSGTAEALLAGVRTEAAARRAIAAEVLPAARGGANSLHVWLDLPARLDRLALAEQARERGLGVATSDLFSAGPPPNGLRLSLGAPGTRASLTRGLKALAELTA
ncbi:PLP-dependent aminotransferase family protein [Caulobacter segnis]|uniref:aminotransferase-like domain-containing protein n=1 Tax=Caulobacter segnis TaxID=88688 RepID=UPI00240F1EC1|nr:PLP-dependent aminotransferase family protein [Caulobacter segnis]MDG2523185.1 PLP-dependent aminotransferase family protein [Caulobacter segnis]